MQLVGQLGALVQALPSLTRQQALQPLRLTLLQFLQRPQQTQLSRFAKRLLQQAIGLLLLPLHEQRFGQADSTFAGQAAMPGELAFIQ